jgi:hypothetical protein
MLPGENGFIPVVSPRRVMALCTWAVSAMVLLWRVTAGGNNVEQLPLTLGEVRSLALDERTQTLVGLRRLCRYGAMPAHC